MAWMMSRVTIRSFAALVSNVSPVASMSSQGESGMVAAGSGKSCSRARRMVVTARGAARRISNKRDMIRPDALVEQPFVTPHHVVHRAGMDVLGRAPVVDDQRAAADRLCDVCVDLSVRIHRAGYVPAAMRAQQNAVLHAILRHRPHRRNPSGIGFDVIDAAW